MAEPEATDGQAPTTAQDVVVVPVDPGQAQTGATGYCRRQPAFFGWMMLIGGILTLAGAVVGEQYNNAGNGIAYIIMGLATMYFQVEDKGDYLLVTSGPMRWGLCGEGKEKIKYADIRDYEVSKTCFFGFGMPCCTSVKLFNSCTCCCNCCGGDMGGCCVQRTVRLTIKERMQAQGARDPDDCCLEALCLENCCGDACLSCGACGCCQSVCNPCGANCCAINTVFISTNDPQGLIELLNAKVTGNGAQKVQYAEI